MASKYLSTGTAAYAFSSRTISGATMAPVFESADAGRGLSFRIGASIFHSRVQSFVSATSVVLSVSGVLPTANGTIDDIILLDLGERHAYQSYLDKIAAKIKDDATKVVLAERKLLLAAAVNQYGRDKPHVAAKEVTGNGTDSYNLITVFGNLWVHGWSAIEEIEFPKGNKPRTVLLREDWEFLDDGTAQDGTNIKLRFLNATPGAAEKFVARINIQLSLPEVGQQNFPDTDENFENITTLASAHICLALAAAYAPSVDAEIGADSVNYHDKSRKYADLARNYFDRYALAVFGTTEETVRPALMDVPIEETLHTGQDYLFHPRRSMAR